MTFCGFSFKYVADKPHSLPFADGGININGFGFLAEKGAGKPVMMKKLLYGRGDPRGDILFGSKQENKFFTV